MPRYVAMYYCQRVCTSICLSVGVFVRSHIKKTGLNFTKFFVAYMLLVPLMTMQYFI